MKKNDLDGYPYYRIIITGDRIPKTFIDFCRRRIGALATFDYARQSRLDVLATAYMLGLKDAVDYVNLKPEPTIDYQI